MGVWGGVKRGPAPCPGQTPEMHAGGRERGRDRGNRGREREREREAGRVGRTRGRAENFVGPWCGHQETQR